MKQREKEKKERELAMKQQQREREKEKKERELAIKQRQKNYKNEMHNLKSQQSAESG